MEKKTSKQEHVETWEKQEKKLTCLEMHIEKEDKYGNHTWLMLPGKGE